MGTFSKIDAYNHKAELALAVNSAEAAFTPAKSPLLASYLGMKGAASAADEKKEAQSEEEQASQAIEKYSQTAVKKFLANADEAVGRERELKK